MRSSARMIHRTCSEWFNLSSRTFSTVTCTTRNLVRKCPPSTHLPSLLWSFIVCYHLLLVFYNFANAAAFLDTSAQFFFVFFSFRFFLFLFILVNPIASSHTHNAPQQNLTQNYSLHPNPMQANSFDASSFTSSVTNNNFNNFDQSNFQMQYQQPQQQTFDQQQYQGGHIQQQFMGQSSQQHQGINNGSSSTYQHSINDLLVQPTATLQQNLFSSQDTLATNQSVSCVPACAT